MPSHVARQREALNETQLPLRVPNADSKPKRSLSNTTLPWGPIASGDPASIAMDSHQYHSLARPISVAFRNPQSGVRISSSSTRPWGSPHGNCRFAKGPRRFAGHDAQPGPESSSSRLETVDPSATPPRRLLLQTLVALCKRLVCRPQLVFSLCAPSLSTL